MNFLIISDANHEDGRLASYHRHLREGLMAVGHSANIILGSPWHFFRVWSVAKRADVIFTHNFPSIGLTILFVSMFLKKKLIVKLTSDYAWEAAINSGKTFLLINDFQNSDKRGKIARLQRLQVNLCKRADTIIVPSIFLADIVSNWGIESEKIRVVPDAIDVQAVEISKEEARKKINIAGNLLVSAGQLTPWRGFRMLIKIMPQLLEINQFFRLIIIGDGSERKKLQSMIRNMGLDKKVYLADGKNNEELAVYMAAADIFILNTGYEGFSHQVLEAMSAGVPLITTAVGGNLEVVRQGKNGFVVKYNKIRT